MRADQRSRAGPWRRQALVIVAIGLATFVVFPTDPLYSANQNSKFLFGLAKAGVGRLEEDWLVAQGSVLPIFDALVFLTKRFAGDWAFHVWHLAMVIVYVTAAYGIARTSGRTDDGFLGRFDGWFLAAFGAWFVALNSNDGTGRFFEGVARQYINGPVFQPASFGVLLLLALLLFRVGQGGWAAVLIVAAAWVHPAYVLPGLLLLAGMAVAARRFPAAGAGFGPLVLAGGVVGCCAAAGFTYALLQPSDPALHAEAVRIITEIRIPQHADPAVWFDFDAQAKIVAVAAVVWLARRDPLGWVLLVATLGTIALSLWTVATDDRDLALAAPWRASAVIVPAAVAILMGRIIEAIAARSGRRPHLRRAAVGVTASVLLIGLAFGAHNVVEAYVRADEPAYFAWVRARAEDGDVFLTPIDQEDFRLATGQPQYVSWKTHPYRDDAVLAWYERIRRARAVTSTPPPDCAALRPLAAEGVTHVVRRTAQGAPDCPAWPVVFDDGAFLVAAHRPDARSADVADEAD